MAANYYTTPLVKVGDSATIFTANIYLSDASNVGSFDLELVVSGNPSDVSYSYAAANLAGFTVFAGLGISGLWTNSDSAGMLLGGFFPVSGIVHRLSHRNFCDGTTGLTQTGRRECRPFGHQFGTDRGVRLRPRQYIANGFAAHAGCTH